MKSVLTMFTQRDQTHSSTQGFTFVEALASLVIITLALGVMGPLFLNQRQSNVNADRRSLANTVAQYYLEDYRYQVSSETMPGASVRDFVITKDATGVNSGLKRAVEEAGIPFGVTIQVRDYTGTTVSGAGLSVPNCTDTVATGSLARCVRVSVRANNNDINSPLLYETQAIFFRTNTRI
jgi:type II secretory pathway pseudopilin PulG